MAADDGEIAGRFAHRPPTTDERVHGHQMVREMHASLAVVMNRLLPESREKSLALTALQEAAMWGNAAIALHMADAMDGEGHDEEYQAGVT